MDFYKYYPRTNYNWAKRKTNLPVKLAKSFLVKSIPDIDKTIRATSCKCVVYGMEGDGIHGIDLLKSIFLDSVTFESILLLLDLGTWVKVFYSDTT